MLSQQVQLLLLNLLIASQVNFIVGAFIGPQSEREKAQGFLGFNGKYSIYAGNNQIF